MTARLSRVLVAGLLAVSVLTAASPAVAAPIPMTTPVTCALSFGEANGYFNANGNCTLSTGQTYRGSIFFGLISPEGGLTPLGTWCPPSSITFTLDLYGTPGIVAEYNLKVAQLGVPVDKLIQVAAPLNGISYEQATVGIVTASGASTPIGVSASVYNEVCSITRWPQETGTMSLTFTTPT